MNAQTLVIFLNWVDKDTYLKDGLRYYKSDNEPITTDELSIIFTDSDLMPKDWVNVNERLPEINTRILAYEPNSDPEICSYCFSNWNTPRGSLGFLDEQDEQPTQLRPEYWMPLPELPK